jgi:hypothetical protein
VIAGAGERAARLFLNFSVVTDHRNTRTPLPRRIPLLRLGKAAPYRRARFERFHVAAYVRATAGDRRHADF